MLFVYMDRDVLPDVVILILRPKGQVVVEDAIALRSRSGLSQLQANWRVVELWGPEATDLLATEEPGIMPWVSLTHIDGDPEPVLRESRRIIDEKAEPRYRGRPSQGL